MSQLLLIVAGMDDEHVAARPKSDVLADAAAEQPLEKNRLPGSDDDSVGVTLLGGVDQPLHRFAGDAGEFDVQVGVGDHRSHPFAMLLPELLVPLGRFAEFLSRIGVVGGSRTRREPRARQAVVGRRR